MKTQVSTPYFLYEPRPKGLWKGYAAPPKCSFELPGPKGPGFPFLDESFTTRLLRFARRQGIL